jgi:hypothetical protein
MRPLISFEVRRPHRIAAAIAIFGLLASAACSALLNRSTTECHTNADCLSLGVLPSCEQGACVNTGIPCFVGAPDSSLDYENACTTGADNTTNGAYVVFDDCTALGVCVPDGGPALAAPMNPPAATSNTPPPTVTQSCQSLAGTDVVYATGSSNFPTLLAAVAPLLAFGLGDSGAPGPSVVWQTTNSCTGVQSVYGPNSTGTPYLMQDPDAGSPASAYAQYYGPDGKTTPCLVGDGGVPVDVGESDVYPSTCPAYSSYTSPGLVPDIHGPIQAMAFVVPYTSHANSISQEAARDVFGTGGMNSVMSSWNQQYVPWVNPAYYAIRNKNTGTQQMIGKAIGVPADQFWGIDQGSASEVVNFLIAQASGVNADEAIGILSVAVYDSDRSNLTLNLSNMRTLAYQAAGQHAAYLPDSTAASFDKQNVRDGHYPIWGPLHLFYSNSNATAMTATSFVNYFGGSTLAESLIDAFISASLIPPCAMSVQRVPQQVGEELGPLEPSTVQSCDCHFLQKVLPSPSLPPECLACTSDSQCPATGRTTCFLGYCE